jgi:hypothetical protein
MGHNSGMSQHWMYICGAAIAYTILIPVGKFPGLHGKESVMLVGSQMPWDNALNYTCLYVPLRARSPRQICYILSCCDHVSTCAILPKYMSSLLCKYVPIHIIPITQHFSPVLGHVWERITRDTVSAIPFHIKYAP